MKCDGCSDLLNDKRGMTRCRLARGKPTDDIVKCVFMRGFRASKRHGKVLVVKLE